MDKNTLGVIDFSEGYYTISVLPVLRHDKSHIGIFKEEGVFRKDMSMFFASVFSQETLEKEHSITVK